MKSNLNSNLDIVLLIVKGNEIEPGTRTWTWHYYLENKEEKVPDHRNHHDILICIIVFSTQVIFILYGFEETQVGREVVALQAVAGAVKGGGRQASALKRMAWGTSRKPAETDQAHMTWSASTGRILTAASATKAQAFRSDVCSKVVYGGPTLEKSITTVAGADGQVSSALAW
ncbi:hypothetical protein K435DRAFT_877985 [Dendrothele bispora CBS 962.96]|uniref:Uncharacterized protein n=1 Tax=Dendrothele bispora (strain CBS 962.96) TaxID=1314807 RepID=A0A4S8KNU0_DENBC|nr:hypothetical protein K435DRAFT_877985 [Dendrothele bispora CBS 962.96]